MKIIWRLASFPKVSRNRQQLKCTPHDAILNYRLAPFPPTNNVEQQAFSNFFFFFESSAASFSTLYLGERGWKKL